MFRRTGRPFFGMRKRAAERIIFSLCVCVCVYFQMCLGSSIGVKKETKV